jgi:hypothetical protein
VFEKFAGQDTAFGRLLFSKTLPSAVIFAVWKLL